MIFFVSFFRKREIRHGQNANSFRVEGRSASMVRTIVVYDSKYGSTELAAK
jgi:hypothetical protein